jgi:colanic acid/amylovoran biosynthesis glycosyltransferase
MSPMPLVYLVSEYPAPNHGYLQKEIDGLCGNGICPIVATVRRSVRGLFSIATVPPAAKAKAIVHTFLRPAALPVLALVIRTYGLRGLAYFCQAAILGEWMLANHLNRVHIHFASHLGLILSKLFPIRVSNTFHGLAEFGDPKGFHLKEKIEASDFVRTISLTGKAEAMRAVAPEHWPKIRMSRLGVDLKDYAPATYDRSHPFTLVCVARLSPEKGHHILIEAARMMAADGCEYRIKFVGDGPERSAIAEHVKAAGLDGKIEITGWLRPELVRQEYRQSHACVLPSFWEGIPITLMEAMASGLPCIATSLPGVMELIDHGISGLLVPPGDARQLAEAISLLRSDSERCRNLGAAARRKVEGEFDIIRNTAAFSEITREFPGGIAPFVLSVSARHCAGSRPCCDLRGEAGQAHRQPAAHTSKTAAANAGGL